MSSSYYKPSRSVEKSRWAFISILVLSILSSYRLMLLHVGISTNSLLIPVQISVFVVTLVCSFSLVRINGYDVLVAAFILIELYTTVANGVALRSYMMETIQLVTLCSVARLLLSTFPREFLRYSAAILCALTVMNTVSAIVVYPGWLYWSEGPFYLLGGDNTSVRIYIIAVLFTVLDSSLDGGHKTVPLVTIFSFIAFVILRDIATGKVCAFVLFAAYIVYYVLHLDRFALTTRMTWLFHGILFVLLIILSDTSLFSGLVVNVLGRNLTLTDRTIIWGITIDKIIESPLIGYGVVSGADFESLLPYIIGVNAHNTFLMIQFIGGAILSVTFVTLSVLASVRYDRSRHAPGIVILPVTLFVMMLHAQVEGGDATYLIYIMLLIYNSGAIENLFEDGRDVGRGSGEVAPHAR